MGPERRHVEEYKVGARNILFEDDGIGRESAKKIVIFKRISENMVTTIENQIYRMED